MRLLAPQRFNDSESVDFANRLALCFEEPELSVDFSDVQWVCPFGTLVVANAIKHAIGERALRGLETPLCGISPQCLPVSYLAYFGFFQFLGLNYGSQVGAVSGKERFLPIRVMQRRDLTKNSPSGVLQDQILVESKSLARVIFPGVQEDEKRRMMSYCFRELIRNSFEHGAVDVCTVMAQRWENGIAEVAISDDGVGIQASMSDAFPDVNESSALQLSIKAGVSGKTSGNIGDRWENTGFGLYVVSELGRERGSFALLSSGRFLTSYSTHSPLPEAALRGTLIKLRVRTSDLDDWPQVFQEISRRGEVESAATPGARPLGSRGMSNTWGDS